MTTKLRALDGEKIQLYSTQNTYEGYIQMSGANVVIDASKIVLSSGGAGVASMDASGQLWKGATAGAGDKYWHSGNDGDGSGLDADTIDGYHSSIASTASTVLVRDANSSITANQAILSSVIAGSGLYSGTTNADAPIWRPTPTLSTNGIFYNAGTTDIIEFKHTNAVRAQVALNTGVITGSSFVSNVANGTAPLTVTSSTLVTNLNADKLDGNDASYFSPSTHTHQNLVAGNGLTGTTYTGGTTQTWSIASHAGTSGSVGIIVVGADTIGVALGTTGTTACAGNDPRLTDAREASAHDDSKHTHQKFIRITYSGSNVGYRWNHGLNSANVIFAIASNTPEAHYHYKVIDNNNVEVYIDDEPYEDTVLDVTATKATTIKTATANIGVI